MEIVTAVAAKIAEVIVVPVGQCLCYACHYKSNMKNLKNQVKRLQNAKKRVQGDVEADSNMGNVIEDDVIMWLEEVRCIIDQLATKKLGGGEEEAESRNSNVSWLNLKQRHQISREANEMMDNIDELLKKANFPRVSYCPAVQDRVIPSNMDYITLDSRTSIMERIMEALGDANIDKIGVWGSPGIGKSTLMKKIFKKAKEASLFDEVALAEVTESPNLSDIQLQIAEMLGQNLDNYKTKMVRAGQLRARLEKDKEKKILVILDDIWKRLDLEEIGIIPSKRCKVLLTSRDRHVLSLEMVTEENSFKLDILGEQEAWNLFEKNAGDSVKDDLDLRNEAIKVAKACGGLPIALVTVSRTLKDHKNLRIWKDALEQLTRPPPEHDTEIWSTVYNCIQLSYKHLGRELQSLFLLCARQGHYISYQDLLRYGFSLCLFHGIHTLDGARSRLESLVSKLQDACLLLQSSRSSEEFYMHDLVRHVATTIASKDHNMFVMRGDGGQKAWLDVDSLKRSEALSIHGGDHIHKYPNKIECPKLRYFHVQCKPRYLKTPSSSLQGMDKLEDIFFQGMEKLEVLSLTNIQLSSLLPLTNLQTLCLDGCKLGDIHWIGELKNLVILSLARSDISNLPGEIGSLTDLKLLDLTDCLKLRVIHPNVLSSLVKLEELYIRNINVQWEVEGPNNEGKNASLAELKHLSRLVTLEIDIIEDANKLQKDLFSKKLERYKIRISDVKFWYLSYFKGDAAFSRSLHFKLNMSSFQLDFGIKMLLKRTEYLYLDELNSTKSVLYELEREDFQQLKHLHILHSWHLLELRTSFKNLKVLSVEDCEKLRFIFSSSIARGLSLLEELKITRCNNVGAIFVKEEEDHEIEEAGDMMFRRLQTLVLMDLPKLVSFLSTRETNSEGNDHDLLVPLLHHQLSFPSLKTLRLERLPKIKHVWSKEIFRFPDLLDLYVARCENLKSLFPAAAVATSLTQLKSLEISDCGVLEEIVQREDGTDPTTRILFPSLTLLGLKGLAKLKWFFQGVRTLESSSSKELHEQGGTLFGIDEVALPKLTNLLLWNLPKIKRVCSKDPQTILRFQNLQRIHVSKCASLNSLFLASIGTCLKQLKQIRISDCGVLEEIVEAEGGETVGRMLEFEFPQVTSLVLENLPRLECFYKGLHISKWPMLEDMSIRECEKVEVLFASGLVSKETVEESQIKQPLFLVDEMSFPCLETLDISKLEKLEIIWYGVVAASLTTLNISDCGSLEAVFEQHDSFPNLLAASLTQLKSLKIKDCGVMEEIVAREDGTDPTARLLFTRLTVLSLDGLPKLKWFYQGVRTLELSSSKELDEHGGTLFEIEQVAFPKLTKLNLCGLPKIKHVWSKETFEEWSRMSIKQPLFLVDEVSFPSLQTLHMKGLPKIKHVWSCGQEPKTVFRCLEQLKILKIEDCEVEEIVAGGGGEAVARTILEFPRVTNLRLTNLKKLKWFYKGVHVSKWPMLEKIWIEGCEKVEIFASGVVSFEETVEERSSEMSIKQPLFLVDELSFSSLKELHIWDMDKLEIIAQDQVAASSFFKNIQAVRILRCEKLLHVFQSNFLTTTILVQRLTSLCISYCSSLETIFRNMEGHNGKEPQVLEAPSSGTEESVAREDGTARHIEFPILTEMLLGGLPKLKWILEGVHTNLEFPSLEKLDLWLCDQVIWASKFGSSSSSQETSQQNQIQTCIQLQLPNLLELQVYFSDREEIFPYELVDPVPRLRALILRSLPMLTHLWKEDSTQPCPLFHNLEFLRLIDCHKLKNIVPSSVFLQNLTEFYISCCDGLINLLTSSTAKTLVQLQKMTVKNCKRITEIVAMEDGEENVAITFNKLADLELEDLPNLTHFCSGPYSFGESLKNVIVTRCPEMKPLCRGVSSTPELKGVYHT